MRTSHASMVLLLASLLVVATGSATLAQGEVPVPPTDAETHQLSFGLVGLARLQTARLNVVAIGGGNPDPSDLTECSGWTHVRFVDAAGQPFHDASGADITASFSLSLGKAEALELRAADAFRGRAGRRVAFQAMVEVVSSPSSSNPCGAVVPTLEIYDWWLGRTALLVPGKALAIGGGQPDPGELPFGMVGLGRLQTARVNAIGGGNPDPSDLTECSGWTHVRFVDAAGQPFHDASGTPIEAAFTLPLDEGQTLDLRAVEAFRGSKALRKAFRAVVVTGAGTGFPPSPCQPPVVTLEVFDNVTGRTTLLYAPMGATP